MTATIETLRKRAHRLGLSMVWSGTIGSPGNSYHLSQRTTEAWTREFKMATQDRKEALLAERDERRQVFYCGPCTTHEEVETQLAVYEAWVTEHSGSRHHDQH